MKWSDLTAKDLKYVPWLKNKPVDPQLYWWDLTQGRGFTGGGPLDTTLPVLVALAKGDSAADLSKLMQIAQQYYTGKPKYLTGTVEPNQLKKLLGRADALQLGLPAVPPTISNQLPGAVGSKDQPYVGIIDDGCAFLNRCFRDANSHDCRVIKVWDQGKSAKQGDPFWRVPSLGYGRELTTAGFTSAHDIARQSGEMAAYRAIDYLVDKVGQLPVTSHGTLVAGLAAGRISTLLHDCKTSVGPNAANASIIAVKLPAATVADTSGRSLVVHVLDAVRYILSIVPSMAPSVVINLSFGSYGGSHDGLTLLDRALDEVQTERKGKLRIVTGAGNGYRAKAHAKPMHAITRRKPAELRWLVPPDDPTDSFVEIWYDRKDALALELVAPDGTTSGWVAANAARFARASNGQAVGLVSNATSVPHGGRSLIQVCLAPTRPDDMGPASPAGIWTLRVKNVGIREAFFDAWIDRDDAAFGARRRQRYPSRFLDDKAFEICKGTLSGLATGKQRKVAGAHVLRDRKVADYSASGSTEIRAPDATLPADQSLAMPGLPGPGVLSGSVRRLSGTSVASALYARHLVDNAPAVKPMPPKDPDREGSGPLSSDLCRR